MKGPKVGHGIFLGTVLTVDLMEVSMKPNTRVDLKALVHSCSCRLLRKPELVGWTVAAHSDDLVILY